METIRFDVAAGVATITLDRPQQKNAINGAMTGELAEAVATVRDDDNIRALVIAGAAGAFCAGGDIKAMLANRDDPAARQARMRFHHRWLEQLVHLDKPVIAAVDGAAFGAGFGLALAADLVIASTRAKFSMAFMKIGLVPDFGALYTLPRIVGLQRAKEIIYSARTVAADEAVSLGIALEAVEAEALPDRARAIATSLAAASPTAFMLSKRALNVSQLNDFRTMLDMELTSQSVAFATPEHGDAVDAFLDKRPPAFEWPARED